MSENMEKIMNDLYEAGLTDGLPVIPPTKERVNMMLEFTDRNPDDSLGQIPPSEYEATVGSVAANAVMAGCKPEYFPVVVAAIEALLDRPNLRATAGRSQPIAIVNGPIAKEVEISDGRGFFTMAPVASPDRIANMTIGRTMMFCIQNIGQSRPVKTELGFIHRIGMCIAEREEDSPWEPLHVERGFSPDTSTVTVFGEKSLRGHNVPGGRSSGVFSIDLRAWANALIPNPAHTLPRKGSTCLIVMGPTSAKYFADNGMDKNDLREFLYENCRMRWKDWYLEYPPESREHILETAFAVAPGWMRDLDLVPLFPNHGKDICIVVAGGDVAMRSIAIATGDHGFDSIVTKPIAFADGTPAKSVYDFKRLH